MTLLPPIILSPPQGISRLVELEGRIGACPSNAEVRDTASLCDWVRRHFCDAPPGRLRFVFLSILGNSTLPALQLADSATILHTEKVNWIFGMANAASLVIASHGEAAVSELCFAPQDLPPAAKNVAGKMFGREMGIPIHIENKHV